ncbi:hypothetical protein GW932_02410 [archaeon]|nr:hypothetical protein [archaeon]
MLVKFIKSYNNKEIFLVLRDLNIIGISYLVVSFISLLWFSGRLEASSQDFIILYGILLFVQSILFFKIMYSFSRNKKLFMILGLYLLLIPFLFLIHASTVLFFIISFLFTLLIFLEFVFRGDVYRKVGYLGLVYSLVSIILNLFLLVGIGDVQIFGFISMVLFFSLIYFFIEDLRKYSILPKSEVKERGYFLSLISHLVFIITLTNFVFIGTIGIHESGHLLTSKFFDCDYGKIVYEGNLFHTETLCRDPSATPFVSLGGILLPLLVAVILLLLKGKFLKEVALLILGFNLISVSRDLQLLEMSKSISFSSSFIGIIFLIFGIFLLAKSKIDDSLYFEDINVFKGGT